MKNKVPKLLRSSQDPEQVSLTVKGLSVLTVALLYKYGETHGYEIPEDQIGNITLVVMALYGSVASIYGLIRKFKK